MKRPKLLVVNYSSPPMASPRAIQVSRLLQALDADVTLVCGLDQSDPQDDTIAPDLDDRLFKVVRIPYNRTTTRRISEQVGNRTGLNHQNLPDVFKQWAKTALKTALKETQDSSGKPDALITFGTPMSTHLLGVDFKKRTGIPWIAHFSDPWADNPYRKDNVATAAINRSLEHKVMEAADTVIFTSPETVELVMRKYPVEWGRKAIYLPHCFDKDRFSGKPAPPTDRYVLRSVGTFYGNRSPGPLYKAIDRMSREHPALLENISMEFAGNLHAYKNLINDYPAAKKILKVYGEVQYARGLELMNSAHCLLAIDAPGDISVFFPSKLVDYIGSGRFILALSPAGASARIVGAAGGMVVDPADDDAVFTSLKTVLEKKPVALSGDVSVYDVANVAAEMLKIVRKAAAV